MLAESSVTIPSAATWKPTRSNEGEGQPLNSPDPPPLPEDEIGDEELQDVEHLQLTLPEAFFLVWAMDCLRLIDPATVKEIQFYLKKWLRS